MRARISTLSILAVLAASALLPARALAYDSLTFQGVTFESEIIDSNTLQLRILNATAASGNWTGVNYIKAFEVKDIGNVTGASVSSGPGSFSATVDAGLAAGAGCTTGGTPGACFYTAAPLSLSDSMIWNLSFSGTNLSLETPSLKVQFMVDAGQTNATGDLLSLPIPEPEVYAMLGIGLALMGFVARRRNEGASLA